MTDPVARNVLLSVVAVTRNDAGRIGDALRQLSELLAAHFRYYEIVVVDDGSSDETVAVIEELQKTLKNIQLYCLPRPKGEQVALVAGLENAIGDLVVVLEPGVDPVEPILEMVDTSISQQTDVVYALPRERTRPSALYDRFSTWFFTLLGRLSDLEIPAAMSRYRLLSRRVLNYVLEVSDRHRTIAVAPALSGYAYSTVSYERRASRRGLGGRRGPGSIGRALDLVISTSMKPLRLVTILSLVFSLLSFLYGVLALVLRYGFHELVSPGWTSLSLQISGLFFLVFIILAVMSEYLLRVSEATNKRPVYHIQKESHSSVMDYTQDLNVDRTRPVEDGVGR